MPILDTYTTTTSSTSRRRRSSVLTGEMMTNSRAAPTGMDYPSDRSSRSSGSSRSQEGSARRTSSHHSRPRRHRSSRPSAEGCDPAKPRRSREEMSQAKPTLPCQDNELFDFFKDTKIEMMRIVEADLNLKLDVRQMKEHFYNLVKNFEAFEQRNLEMDVKSVISEKQLGKTPLYKRQRSTERRRRSRRANIYSSQRSAMTASSSLYSQHCPNNTKASPDRENWASLLGSNDTAELPSDVYSRVGMSQLGEQEVENISAITRCSNVTYREQVSQSHIIDVPGPLSSTMSYPQYSTPEKQLRLSRIEDVDAEVRQGCSRKLSMDEPRSRAAVLAKSSKVIQNNSTDSDATPVVAQRSRPVSQRVPTIREDSELYDGAETPRADVTSHRYYLSGSGNYSSNQATPVARRQESDSDSMDSKLRRQTAQPCLGNELRSPVGLSETDLMDPSSFFDQTVTDIQCSINATRASVANLSALSISPDHGSANTSPTSDITTSTGVESSYKESDATNSSSRLQSNATKQSRTSRRQHSRHHLPMRISNTPRRALSQCTSATSTSSYGGMVAPSNSPNMTSESASNRIYINSKSVESMEIENIGLGSRPPCVGSDNGRLVLPPRPISARALSDPESTVTCMGTSRSTRRADQVSGASSTGSVYASDKSHSSLDSSKGNSSKESKGSSLDIPRTPRKNVRRSFSKKIMNLGKQLLRGNSSKNKSSEEQHSV